MDYCQWLLARATHKKQGHFILVFYFLVHNNIRLPLIVTLIQLNCLAIYKNMSRSESIPVSLKKSSNSKQSIRNYQPASYFGPPPVQTFQFKGPKSQKSFDGGSVKSFNAVEGSSSLRGSIASVNSGVSGLSRKSEKSVLSNYPPMMNKDMIKNPVVFDVDGTNKQERKSVITNKNLAEKQVKKSRIDYYVDQDYFYSSQFKRNFVKGMLALAKSKNIQDLSLLLKEVAPTIKVRSSETSIWVSAFLIIFKIEHDLRRIKPTQQGIIQLIEDYLIKFMHQNKNIKKAKLLKILIYIFRQLPVYRTKVIQWFEDFVRRNADRLSGIDLSKYVDKYTINPCPIDYENLINLSKKNLIKSKQVEKQKEEQKAVIDNKIQIPKAQEVVAHQKIQEPKQILKDAQKVVPILEKNLQSIGPPVEPQRVPTKENNQIEAKSIPAISAVPSPLPPPLNNTEKVLSKKQNNANATEPQLSLEELISRRIQSNPFSGFQKTKPKQVMKPSQKKEQPLIKQPNQPEPQKISTVTQKIQQKDANIIKEPVVQPSTSNELPKASLTQKIKRLAKDRHEQIKSKAKDNGKLEPEKPEQKQISHSQSQPKYKITNQQMEDSNEFDQSQQYSDQDMNDDDSFVDVSEHEEDQNSNE